MDYVPWGLLAIAAIVFGGASVFAIPPLGLLGIGLIAYYAWLTLTRPQDDGAEREEDVR